jgi:hypothetical protein
MASRSGRRRHRPRQDTLPPRQSPNYPILGPTIEALHWRLGEGATRIADAKAALCRGQSSRAMEHLFELEPLVFEAERILSATFLLVKETGPEIATSPD